MTNTITDRQFEIIEAAGKILTQSGVGGLTIKNLAKEMKFSESAIYRHFSSKEEIIVSLLEYLADNMNERFTLLSENELEIEDHFVALFQNQFRFFNANQHFVVAVFSDGLLEESDKINSTIKKIMHIKMAHLKPIIIKGQQKQIFTSEIPTENLIHIVMGAMRLEMYKWRVANFEFDIIESGNNVINSLLKLIKTR